MENANDSQAASSAPKFSGFKMTTQKKTTLTKTTLLSNGVVELEEEDMSMKRSVAYLEDGIVKDADDFPSRKKAKKEYVIPMKRTGNDWRIERLKKIIEEGTGTQEDKARLALMMDALGGGGEGEEENAAANGNGSISFVESDALEESIDADYDKIPINEFGLAFLRGCGWKESDGIGKSNRQTVKLQISTPRPKGLGLGADVGQAGKDKKDPTNGKTRELEKKARVKILSGTDRGCSGQVQSMDEDNSSCFVELDNTSRIVRVSRFALEVVENKVK